MCSAKLDLMTSIRASFLPWMISIFKKQLWWGSLEKTEAGSKIWTSVPVPSWVTSSAWFDLWGFWAVSSVRRYMLKKVFAHGWHWTILSDDLEHTYVFGHDLLAWSSKARMSLSTTLPPPYFPLLFHLTKLFFTSCCRLLYCTSSHCSVQLRYPPSGRIVWVYEAVRRHNWYFYIIVFLCIYCYSHHLIFHDALTCVSFSLTNWPWQEDTIVLK